MSALNLPIHPFTGLRAIGVLPSGRIVWPVLGGNGQGDGGGSGGSGSGSGGGAGTGQGGAGDGGGQGGSGGNNDDGKSDRTFTQADLDRIVAERLTRERGKYGDYEALKTKAEKLDQLEAERASDAEKAAKKAGDDAAAAVRSELEPQMLRLEVALAKGLPAELGARVLSAAKRLVGATREELEADAAEFFKAAPISVGQQHGGNGNGFDQGSRGGGGTGKPTVASGADLYAQRHSKKT
jgi:hypothetical protein